MRRESPIRRENPSGKVRWVARYTNTGGQRRSAGTFDLKRDAQAAIDRAYGQVASGATLGEYAATWLDRHPRARRTNLNYHGRVNAVLDVKIEGRPLKAWPLSDLHRRHALELVAHLLAVQGRAQRGALGIIRVLSALTEDAITDGHATTNAFKGVRIKQTDPRILKSPRAIRVWSWDQMHQFAEAAGRWEAMVRALSDTGLRLGELLALERRDVDGDVLLVRRTAWRGRVTEGTKAHREGYPAARRVPVPPTLAGMLDGLPRRIDTPLLFPTSTGRVWGESYFYRTVWAPTIRMAGIDPRPHEFRHSYITLMRAAGIDDADLAERTGHLLSTMVAHYAHPLSRSDDQIRTVIG